MTTLTKMTNLRSVTVDEHGVPVAPVVTIRVPMTPWQIVRAVRDNQYSDDYADIYYHIGLDGWQYGSDSDVDTVILYRTLYEDGTSFNSVSVEFV